MKRRTFIQTVAAALGSAAINVEASFESPSDPFEDPPVLPELPATSLEVSINGEWADAGKLRGIADYGPIYTTVDVRKLGEAAPQPEFSQITFEGFWDISPGQKFLGSKPRNHMFRVSTSPENVFVFKGNLKDYRIDCDINETVIFIATIEVTSEIIQEHA